jgi:HD-like signal output (HDOD) protein
VHDDKQPPVPAREERPAEPPAPIRAATTVVAQAETATDAALDEALAALVPEEKELQYRLDLVRHAQLEFPELGAEIRRLLDVIAGPKVFMHQLVRETGRHPVLSSKLMRLANTLYYSPPKPVRNLNFALVVLGIDGIRSAALAQAVHDTFDFSRPLQVELWHHSIAVAVAAGLIGRAARHPKPDELYALGLVHALGEMVLLHNRGEAYAKLADLMQIENVPAREVEREAFGFTSGEVGLAALALWRLPRAMQVAVLYGDQLDAAGLRRFGREATVFATVLSAADAAAKKAVPVATIPADADVNLAAHRAVKALHLSPSRVDDLCHDLRDHYQEQRGFL